MLSETYRWEIIKSHFKNKGLVQHQTETFEDFINMGLRKIITEEPEIIIKNQESNECEFKSYLIKFSNIYIPKPSIIEENRKIKNIYPNECRQRDLTYDSPVYVNLQTTLEKQNGTKEVKLFPRIVIARIPIMLRSSKCHLSNMTDKEKINVQECITDHGGYFIVRGKERVLMPQIRGVYNKCLVLKQKSISKYKYKCMIRSMSEETGHSVLVEAMIDSNNNISINLPYIKKSIELGIVFNSMNIFTREEIIDIIGIKNKKIDKYVDNIIENSLDSNGSELYKDNLKKNDAESVTEWSKLSCVEKEKLRRQYIQKISLEHIGKFGVVDKDKQNVLYGKQVINNEIFPHMGITASIKEKHTMFGVLIKKLLLTDMNYRQADDRDNLLNKRVDSTGRLYYDLFRQLFKK